MRGLRGFKVCEQHAPASGLRDGEGWVRVRVRVRVRGRIKGRVRVEGAGSPASSLWHGERCIAML
jgi:hypothetical protein